MCMATFTDDTEQIDREFALARQIFEEVKTSFFPENDDFKELSMGMSDDYQIALRHGSTLVRIGTRIFGERVYG